VYAPPDPDPPSPPSFPPRGEARPVMEVTRRYKPGVPYSHSHSPRQLSRDYLLDASYSGVLAGTISTLVKVEGPIHHDLLVERLKELHGIARAGSNVQSNIEQALRSAARSRAIAHDAGSPFYCVPESRLESFRLPTESVRRPIEHIAPGEISLAVLYLVEDQFGIVEESLPTAIARLFSIERLRSESADIIRRVIEDLVTKGSLRRNGMQVHLI
jgi:Protein of unknown function (DUF3320)